MTQELEQRVAVLEDGEVALKNAIAELTEEIERLKKPVEVSSFSDSGDVEPEGISIRRKGAELWYVFDKVDPSIHYEIPGNRIKGHFLELEAKEGEYKEKPTRTLILTLRATQGGKPIKRIRIGSPGSVSVRTFCEQFSYVPDDKLDDDLIFQVNPGKDDSAVAIEILNSKTQKSFRIRSDFKSDEEKEAASAKAKAQWNDESYWEGLLQNAIARINRNPEAQPASTQQQVSGADPKAPVMDEEVLVEMREGVLTAMTTAKVSKEDAIAYITRKFKKKSRQSMTYDEMSSFTHWLNLVEIIHGEMSRAGFTEDQEGEMVTHVGVLAKKKLSSDRISVLDAEDLEKAIEWLGRMPGSAE